MAETAIRELSDLEYDRWYTVALPLVLPSWVVPNVRPRQTSGAQINALGKNPKKLQKPRGSLAKYDYYVLMESRLSPQRQRIRIILIRTENFAATPK